MFREQNFILRGDALADVSAAIVPGILEPSSLRPRVALATLKAGESCNISQVVAGNDRAKRLADLGFVSGVRVEMVRPGVPCIVRVDDTCIALGRAYQTAIEVSPG